jgi:hypothetical protein
MIKAPNIADIIFSVPEKRAAFQLVEDLAEKVSDLACAVKADPADGFTRHLMFAAAKALNLAVESAALLHELEATSPPAASPAQPIRQADQN